MMRKRREFSVAGFMEGDCLAANGKSLTDPFPFLGIQAFSAPLGLDFAIYVQARLNLKITLLKF